MVDRQLNEHDILVCCALRFNGYGYQSDHSSLVPHKAVSDFLNTGRWQASDLELLASFFFLQRSLCKWDLVREPINGEYWQAFRSLFLQINGAEIPETYQQQEYCQQWNREFLPYRDECVRLVRSVYERNQSTKNAAL